MPCEARLRRIESATSRLVHTAYQTGTEADAYHQLSESVEAQLHAAWEATGVDFAVLEYEGNGVFSGEGEAVFYGPGRDGTPSWCSWVEERYSFLVEIDGVQKRWGSSFGGNSFTPDGTESFYYIYEFDKADWDALWKMDHALDLKNVRVTVWTNKDNQFTHMVEEAGPIQYDQPTSTPAELFLTGAAAETDGQAFRKDGDKFIAYAKLNAGALSFVDGDGVKYFIQNDNDLYIGKRSYDVTASEGVTRVTVDFSTNKVTFDEIGTDVRMIWGCNYETVIALSTRVAASSPAKAASSSWMLPVRRPILRDG